jgi:hypothetical protein
MVRAFFSGESAALEAILSAPNRLVLAALIVLLAGLSDGIGQSVVLFANRVRPARFILSLAVNALFFYVGYLVWVLSIGFVASWFFDREPLWMTLAISLAICYLPLLFGFLGLLPYAGYPLMQLLYTVAFIALVNILTVVLELQVWQAFACALGGYLFILLLRTTVGRPILWLGDRLLDMMAGTRIQLDLATALSDAAEGHKRDSKREDN